MLQMKGAFTCVFISCTSKKLSGREHGAGGATRMREMVPPPRPVGRDQSGPYAFFAHRAKKDAHPAYTLSFAVLLITGAALVMPLVVTQLSEECTYEMRPAGPRHFFLLSRPRRPSSPAARS